MVQQVDIMYKFTPPHAKRGPLWSEDLPIPSSPNAPGRSEHNLKEEWLLKILLGVQKAGGHILSAQPINLEITPDPLTEIAVEEEMEPILMQMGRTKYTKIILLISPPMSPEKEVSSA